MYQEPTNFAGRDGFHWWIGQVTDPKKGEWENSLEKKEAENEEPVYSHRCRVRIVGYHGCGDELPDNKLPMAHVLLPSNVSTTGGRHESMQYQGGEVVVGFFLDGEDAQQPVIFGTLFKQSYTVDTLKNSEFNAKKQTCFQPYTPPDVRSTAGDHEIQKNKSKNGNGNGNGANSEWNGQVRVDSKKTISEENANFNTEFQMENSTQCGDNEVSKIENALKEFS